MAEPVVRQILAAAQRTPSWCNAQPWQVVVTSAQETTAFQDRLAEVASRPEPAFDVAPPSRYEGAYRERRRDAGLALYRSLGIDRDDQQSRARQVAENFRFFGAPHVAVLTSDSTLGGYGYLDCGAYLANFMIAAQSHGLATIAQGLIARHSDVVREHFGLPATRHVLCTIAFGHADDDHPANRFRTDRARLEDAVELRGF